MKSLFHLTLVLAIFASSSAFAFGINSPFRRNRGNIRGPIYGVPAGGFPGYGPGAYGPGPAYNPGYGSPYGPGYNPGLNGPVGAPFGGLNGQPGAYGPGYDGVGGYGQPGVQGGLPGGYPNGAGGQSICSSFDGNGQYFQGQGFDGNQAAQQAMQICYSQSNNNCQLAGCQ